MKKGRNREKDNVELCEKLFQKELNMSNVQVEGVARLGRRNQRENSDKRKKPGSLFVKLTNTKEKFDILKRGTLLKQSQDIGTKRIFIAPDLTKLERKR